MQQAKGPREQTNYRDTKTPPKSEHRRVKVNLTVSVRLTSFSIVQVQHTLAPPPPPQTSGALRKAKRESDTACICRIGAPSLARSSEFVSTKPQAHHLYVSLGEEHETNHLEVDIKLKEDVQSVYNISKNPHGAALGRRFFSHLIISLTKDLTKSIRVQLDTACTCNTIPEKIAQSLISPRQKLKNCLTPSKQPLFTYDNCKLTTTGKLE